MFALVLLSIIKDSLDYDQSRNGHGENWFHKEKIKDEKNYGIAYFFMDAFSASHLIKLFISFRMSV